jgi:23S rRNA pseudouridine1911/1915/1917 synthase
MVVARTDQAHRALARQLQERTMKRGYVAVVVGEVPDAEARIDARIDRDPRHRQKMAVVAEGRQAITDFKRLKIVPGHSLLELSLQTGRTHQIRVHLAYIRYPLLGDPVYGRRSTVIDRPALHARYLTLRHPTSGRLMRFKSAIPEDIQSAWRALGGDKIP